ncbi:MAG TPA: mechanosensitive ion channel family protein [Pyrinomonadaceae bacterium]|nr:mechanosensitive ion channel family protein [Pyrinomonadaceae bacterium]
MVQNFGLVDDGCRFDFVNFADFHYTIRVMQSDLRKQFIIFLILSAILILLLTLLESGKTPLKDYVMNLFISSEDQMGTAAGNLFTNIIGIFKILLWMGFVVVVVRFINLLVFNTVLRNTSNYELAILLRNVISIIIYVVSFTTIFKSQFPGTDLSTVFAGSTIVGVVIGLALQDTLGNLFAGIAMQADQPFQIGDVINVQGKATGVVESISWRGVKIRTFQNKVILVSNSVISKEFIEVAPKENLNARIVFFNTLYSVSPTKTAQLIRDIVRQVENVSPKIRPVVRIKNLGDNGIDWEVKFWLEDYAKYNDTDALVRQRVWYAFQRENIHFAFPTRTLFIEEQSLEPNFTESVNEIFMRLSDVEIFAPLSDEETQKLAEKCEAKIFSPNEPIVRKGQEGKSMFVVHRGSVKIQIMENGMPKTVATLKEGEIFGEMGLFTGEPRSATVVAAEETEVLEIKHTAVKPLFKRNPALMEALSETIAERKAMLTSANEEKKEMAVEKEGIFVSIKKFFGLS